VTGTASQFRATIGPGRRPADASWIARAAASFPVPISPSIRTGAFVSPKATMRSNASLMAGLFDSSLPHVNMAASPEEQLADRLAVVEQLRRPAGEVV